MASVAHESPKKPGQTGHEVDDRQVAVAHDPGGRRTADLARSGSPVAKSHRSERRSPAATSIAPCTLPHASSSLTPARSALRAAAWPTSQMRDGGADARDLVIVLDRAQEPQRVRVGLHRLDAGNGQGAVLDGHAAAQPERGEGRAARGEDIERGSRKALVGDDLAAAALQCRRLVLVDDGDDGAIGAHDRERRDPRTDSAPRSRRRRSP